MKREYRQTVRFGCVSHGAASIRVLAGLASFVVVTFTLPAMGQGAGEPVDPFAGVEEMVVVGSGSAVLLQGIPDSALAFDAMELEAAQITDISGLADYTPNLEIKTGASSVSSPTIFIRGIGLLDFNSNAASSVAIYNDGVYMNSPLGQLFQFFDVEAVEVKRGPQGSRLSRNATAGTIRIIPKRPDDEFNASTKFSYGNYNAVDVEGTLNTPIVPELLSLRIAGKYSIRDGYTKNRCGSVSDRTGNNGFTVDTQCRGQNPANPGPPEPTFLLDVPGRVNDLDNWAARGLFKLTPSSDQEWVLNVNGGKTSALAYQFQSRGTNFGGTNINGYADRDYDAFAGDYDLVEPENLSVVGSALNGRIDFDDRYSIRTTTGFQRAKRAATRNIDGGSTLTAHIRNEDTVYQISEELTLESTWGEGFDFEVGMFILHENLDSRLISDDFLAGPPSPNPFQPFLKGLIRDTEQKSLTYALWFHGELELSESVTLSAGIRYNEETKEFSVDIQSGFPLIETDQDTWRAPTGEVVLTWSPTEDVSIYGRYTRGFKTGHYNGGIITNLQELDIVDPETVDAFEVGLKSEWFAGDILLNMALWYYDYRDYQVFTLTDSAQAVPLPELLNASKLESYGIELDLKTRPMPNMRLDVSLALLEAVFLDFTVQRTRLVGNDLINVTKNFSGNPLVAAPPISATFVTSYDFDFGELGIVTPRVDASYRGKTYFSPGVNTASNLASAALKNEGASQDAYWLLNARLAYRTVDGVLELAAWVRNLTDEVYLANSLDVTSGLRSYLDVHGLPRTYGATLLLNW